MRRAGRLDEVKSYIAAAEKTCKRSSMAGLAFCKGLSHFYQNAPDEALKELNFARQDNTFGTQASCTMIEIYLNPAQELQFSSIDGGINKNSTTKENINVAKDLIEELAGRGVDTTMLEVSALIATNQKETLDMAEKSLKTLISKNQGYVPGLV